MSNRRFDDLETCEHIALRLFLVLVCWSFFLIEVGLFIETPSDAGKVFIADAKPYFFEKSDFISKKNEFRAARSLWLSLPYVSDVGMAGEVEGSELDYLEPSHIYQVTIEGETIKYSQNMTEHQHKLFERALNDLSAARWRSINRLVGRWVIIWFCLLLIFIASIVYLKKHFGWHFSITVELDAGDRATE